jgi:trehalose/maltose hydrolase-like predicted phosphorylase
MNQWTWTYDGYEPEAEGLREALLTLGNGYFATRGALAESPADDVHYPGTYIAGVYNRLGSEIAGRWVENESLVNVPNWLVLTFATDDGAAFDVDSCEVLDHHLELDLRRGLLTRRSRLREPAGRILAITQRRFVSMRDPHLAGIECTLVAENWSGPLLVDTALDGRVTNHGVARYRSLPSDHLEPVIECFADVATMCLEVQTNDSHIRIAQSARTRVIVDGAVVDVPREHRCEPRYTAQRLTLDLREGTEVTLEKIVAMFTSRDDGIYEPHHASEMWASSIAGSFEGLLERHVLTWAHAWNRSRIDIENHVDHTGRVLNLHLFHLLQTTSKNTAELDVGVPARGLHGEAYRGHVFWDELFIFPFLNWRIPELTRALLRYRARRLDQARRLATEAGFRGAMYPWQSASDGREETQTVHLNPESGRWLPDASHLQRHINAAVVYKVWGYWQVSGDLEFMRFWGAEMILEIARFWSSAAHYNHALDRFEIHGVVGPDEYHEAYPDAEAPGLRNNAYTNVMAVWCLCRAFDALALLPEQRRHELREKLDLTQEELDRWGDISRKMKLCFHDDGILSQFEGYDELEELDWDAYRARYGHIGRLDRILEAEGDSPNRYKLSKQADTLMLLYLFSAEELAELIERLGYDYDDGFIPRNIAYYEARTSHGSTLSHMVHAWLHARSDRERAWHLFRTALMADVADEQQGTTEEGIHLGAMAGTVDLVQRCFTGIETRRDRLVINPVLPTELANLHFQVTYRRHTLDLTFTAGRVIVHALADGIDKQRVTMEIAGTEHTIGPGETVEVDLPM